MYLAGPMAGYPEHNYPLFDRVAKYLRADGYFVCSPHEVPENIAVQQNCTEEEAQKAWARCLVQDLKVLFTCNSIILLPGWEDSRGATFEVLIAKVLGFKMFLLTPGVIADWIVRREDMPLHEVAFRFIARHCISRQ